MNFLRGRPAYPKDRDLSRVVQAAVARLAEKIESLDPHSLDLSPDACSLICQRRERVKEEIERCAHVFAWALPRNEKPFSDLSLVAFADRLGLFALLARECNVGTVVCHNTEGADVDDARIVAKAIGRPADHYVFGDLDDLEFVMRHRGIPCDVFVSQGARNIIEQLDMFFDTACGRAHGAVSLGLGFERRRCSTPAQAPPDEGSAARIRRCCDRLAAAGFEMNVVRRPSGGSLRMIRRQVARLFGWKTSHRLSQEAAARGNPLFIVHGTRIARRGASARRDPTVPLREPTGSPDAQETFSYS